MKRPKVEDFKVEYIKGCAEISSVIKQYSKAQDLYINELVKLNLPVVVKSLPNNMEQFEAKEDKKEEVKNLDKTLHSSSFGAGWVYCYEWITEQMTK